jgi:hypothetical protein
LAFVVQDALQMMPKKPKRQGEGKHRKETPLERATRKYFENLSDEVIAEENALQNSSKRRPLR